MNSVERTVREALFTVAQSAVTGDGTHSFAVVYDVPPAASTPDDVVAVGRVERVPTMGGMVGSMTNPNAMQDEVTVHIVVEVFRAGYDPQTVYDRCCELVDAVETGVRTDPSLGGAVYVSRITQGSYQCQTAEDHNGLVGSYDLAVTAKAFY